MGHALPAGRCARGKHRANPGIRARGSRQQPLPLDPATQPVDLGEFRFEVVRGNDDEQGHVLVASREE